MKKKKTIFISYSHADEKWKELLLKHLKVLVHEDDFDVWEDRKIKPGGDWQTEIDSALKKAAAAILLVSADFLISDFIRETEVPILLERRKNEGLTVIPLILRPCAWEEVPWISKIQAVPKDGSPLARLKRDEQETVFKDLAGMMADMQKGKTPGSVVDPSKPSYQVRCSPETLLMTKLPERNIDLIGRRDVLISLETKLHRSQRVLLVNGIGGIGKTETCKTFFMDHYRRYRRAAWVDYGSNLRDSFINAFDYDEERMNMAREDTPVERFRKIEAYLRRPGGDGR